MNIGIIGAGARGTSYIEQWLSGIRKDVFIKALCDIDPEKLDQYVGKYFNEIDKPKLYTSYMDLLMDKEINAVIICTPDTTHKEISIAAMKCNKHILLEKPIATTISDCMDIYNEGTKHTMVFRLGFVLRYTSIYKKIKEIVSKGELGRVVTVEAKETLGYLHGGSFFRRWHRFRQNNGGLLNAKCSHDLDLLNWIIGAEPTFVAAYGGRIFFNSIPDAAERCSECTLSSNCRYFYKSKDYGCLHSVEDLCVFNSQKDIVDHEVVIIEYDNGVTANFTVCTLSAEANRTMTVFGTEATLSADFSRGIINIKFIQPQNEIIYKFDNVNSEHGGGDRGIYINFVDSVRGCCEGNVNDARAGLLSSIIALAGEICMEEKRTVNLNELYRGKN